VIYSVTFTVSGIITDVDGTVSPVSLATGGDTFTVTMANTPVLHGTNLALLQLNPVVTDTPDGYSLIPSSVGVLRQSEGQGESTIGWRHNLSSGEGKYLQMAEGSLSADLVSLSATGTTTAMTIQVYNTGTVPVNLLAIGMVGNFNAQGGSCQGGSTTMTTTTSTGTSASWWGSQPWMNGQSANWQKFACWMANHWRTVAFVPVLSVSAATSTATSSSTTTSNSCGSGELEVLARLVGVQFGGMLLSPGQCVELTFSGPIAFGDTGLTVVPSTASGQVYHVSIVASPGASITLLCTLGSPNSCTPEGPRM
jgi:hypothetical protein